MHNKMPIDTAAPPTMSAELVQRITLQRRIGSGSQGQVWLARVRRTGQPVAVKLLHVCRDSQNELDIYRHLQQGEPHQHVLHLLFAHTSP